MKNKDLFMGIDTSNYKTSLALVNLEGEIIKDLRKFLLVAPGQKGLRQSEAVFQHINNLPLLAKELFKDQEGERVLSITASVKPRPIENSYMPCFKVGESFGIGLASALNVPINLVSHQEGHISAIQENSVFQNKDDFLVIHLSGGTTEVLRVKSSISLLGGTKDISYGQVLDRAGVKMGLTFPCGQILDAISASSEKGSCRLKAISFSEGYINLSGIDTQLSRALDEILCMEVKEQKELQKLLIREVFDKINESLIKLINFWSSNTACYDVLITGGVACSKTIRNCLNEAFKGTSITLEFGKEELASDNAVGLAFLGRKSLCQKTQ